MRTWKSASRVIPFCGGCGGRIEKGEPYVEIHLTQIADPLRRCKSCAGEPVPANLPEQREQQRGISPRPLVRLGAVRLPFDRKLAAVGEREPGEDDQ